MKNPFKNTKEYSELLMVKHNIKLDQLNKLYKILNIINQEQKELLKEYIQFAQNSAYNAGYVSGSEEIKSNIKGILGITDCDGSCNENY